MKRILFIHSSLFGDDSVSTRIARSLVERMIKENPGSDVTRVDLAEHPMPHLEAEEFKSWLTPADQLNETQKGLAGHSDKLIDQLLSHDTLVLAVPMYNLGIPSTLKSWIDRVSRAGKTFRYTAEGPVGMVGGMRAHLVFARGGIYRDTPLDTQTSYLISVLGLMGVETVETIFAEGLNMGEETREKAMVLSARNGVVLQMADHIESGIPGRLIFPDVPENLRDRPTLTMLVQSKTGQSQEVELSYLTSGLGWQADYVAELNAQDDAMDLSGWVTLSNRSGATYQNASLQLVAGDVNQVEPERSGRKLYRQKGMAMAAEMDDAMAEEQMFEYHLYTLARPTTIKDNQTKQVALLQAGQVPCRKEFLLPGNRHYYQSQYGEIGRKIKIGVFVEVANSKENNLGMPLPKGVVRVYKKDSKERLQFVGEDRIDHTPEKETIRLKLGDAFDITANKKQTDFKKLSGFSRYHYVYESAYRIELKNGKKEAVTVKVVEPVPGDWDMLEESLPHEKAASNTAVWQVAIPALETTVLTYRIRVKL